MNPCDDTPGTEPGMHAENVAMLPSLYLEGCIRAMRCEIEERPILHACDGPVQSSPQNRLPQRALIDPGTNDRPNKIASARLIPPGCVKAREFIRENWRRRMLVDTMSHLYDRIGRGSRAQRRRDPRIAGQILRALGSAWRVASIGAGTGSNGPRDREVVAVEPSITMIRQRRAGLRLAVQAVADR